MDHEKQHGLLNALSKHIREIRLARGLSQKQLSYSCNMEKSSLSKIENGKINTSINTLAKIGKCLDVDLKEMIPD